MKNIYLVITIFIIVSAIVAGVLYIKTLQKPHVQPIKTSTNKQEYLELMLYFVFYGNKSDILELSRILKTTPVLLYNILRMHRVRIYIENNVTLVQNLTIEALKLLKLGNVKIIENLINKILKHIELINSDLQLLNITYTYSVSSLLPKPANIFGRLLLRNYTLRVRLRISPIESIVSNIVKKVKELKSEFIRTSLNIYAPSTVFAGSSFWINGSACAYMNGSCVPIGHVRVIITLLGLRYRVLTDRNGRFHVLVKLPLNDQYVGKLPIYAVLNPVPEKHLAGSVAVAYVNVLPLPVSLELNVSGTVCSHGLLHIVASTATALMHAQDVNYAGIAITKLGNITYTLDFPSIGLLNTTLRLPYGNFTAHKLCLTYIPYHRYLQKVRKCINITELAHRNIRYSITVYYPKIVLFPYQETIAIKVETHAENMQCNLQKSDAMLIIAYGSKNEIMKISTERTYTASIHVVMRPFRMFNEMSISLTLLPSGVCVLPSHVVISVLIVNANLLIIAASLAVATFLVLYMLHRRYMKTRRVESAHPYSTAVKTMKIEEQQEESFIGLLLSICRALGINIRRSDTVRQIVVKIVSKFEFIRDMLIRAVRLYEAVRFGNKTMLIEFLKEFINSIRNIVRQLFTRK